jgi:hypothetical protein
MGKVNLVNRQSHHVTVATTRKTGEKTSRVVCDLMEIAYTTERSEETMYRDLPNGCLPTLRCAGMLSAGAATVAAGRRRCALSQSPRPLLALLF